MQSNAPASSAASASSLVAASTTSTPSPTRSTAGALIGIALGVGTAAFEDALRYSQERESFGKPIWQHQSIGNYLADMATKLTAARQLILFAATKYDAGRRCDMEAGMAKLFASEVTMEVALNAVRIHGGYGYSTEFDVERYFREARLMRIAPISQEMVLNYVSEHVLGLPRSY